MPRDLMSIVEEMIADGHFRRLLRNPRAQFGTSRRRYLGAEILPEREVTSNAYTEDAIRFRTLVANDGTRYSPAQKKASGILVGSFKVELGYQDIATEMDARTYDALRAYLNNNSDIEAMARMANWVDGAVNRALIERTEVQRWQAILDAQVVREGDNGYREILDYPNPAGQRANVGGDWADPSYDAWLDIEERVQFLTDKGYTVSRIITSTKALSLLRANAKVAARVGAVAVAGDGTLTTVAGTITRDRLNALASESGLPKFETYDLRYQTEGENPRFMRDTAMTFVSQTGRDEDIDYPEGENFTVPDVAGYVAIGTGAGQAEPGRAVNVEVFRNKPPRIEAEGWQASLPVLADPEAIATLDGIGE
jgi:hypothetical protein